MGILDLLMGRYDSAAGKAAAGQKAAMTSNSHFYIKGGYGNHPYSRSVRRGYMTTPPSRKPKIILNFMYNPNEINFAYDVNESLLAQETQDQENPLGSPQIPLLVGGASVSFVLLFDRTMEAAGGGKSPNAYDPAAIGVLADLAVFEKLVGADFNNGQLISTPAEVKFSSGTTGAGGPLLGFTGYIIAAGVTMTQFTQNMVPTRCELSVRMRKVFVPPPEGTTPPVNPQDGKKDHGGLTGHNLGGLTGKEQAEMTDEEWRAWLDDNGL